MSDRLDTKRHKNAEIATNTHIALAAATELLEKRGGRLTTLRRAILQLLCQEEKAIGAYALVSALSKDFGRRITPETVYRTLDFLEEHGLVAHLLSSRTYVARSSFYDDKTSVFFVCSRCAMTAESRDSLVEQAVRSSASAIGFVVPTRVIDLVGVCKRCALASKQEV